MRGPGSRRPHAQSSSLGWPKAASAFFASERYGESLGPCFKKYCQWGTASARCPMERAKR